MQMQTIRECQFDEHFRLPKYEIEQKTHLLTNMYVNDIINDASDWSKSPPITIVTDDFIIN